MKSNVTAFCFSERTGKEDEIWITVMIPREFCNS